MPLDPTTGRFAAAALSAAIVIGTASVARAFDQLERWVEGSEERLVVFPTYAKLHADGGVTVPVHAWTYEPEKDSRSRELLVDSLQSWLDIDGEEERDRFERRLRPFLVDNERGQRIDMKIGGESYRVGTTAPDGHAAGRIRLPRGIVERAQHAESGARWLEPTFETEFGNVERAIPIIEREGVTVVSDVDDTIKVTDVLDRKEMLRNTFLREFRPVDGMPELYRRIARRYGAVFHYLSASPWQLLPFLQNLIQREQYPRGLFHLRSLRVKSISSPLDFIGESKDYKIGTLNRLLSDFPERTFLLVGDSGEHDPEVYGRVARNHPDQIARIWIREVEGGDNGESRFEDAFTEVPPKLWKTFDDPSSLELPELPDDSVDSASDD